MRHDGGRGDRRGDADDKRRAHALVVRFDAFVVHVGRGGGRGDRRGATDD